MPKVLHIKASMIQKKQKNLEIEMKFKKFRELSYENSLT